MNKKAQNSPDNGKGLCRGCVPLKTAFWVDFRRLRLDKRTKLAKTIAFLRKELTNHVGGEPSIAQSILIDRVVHKVVKAHLYEQGFLSNPEQGNRDHYLALVNSLRLDLQALGLQAKIKEPPDLEDLIRKFDAEKRQ